MMRFWLLLPVLALVTTIAIACGGGSDAAPADTESLEGTVTSTPPTATATTPAATSTPPAVTSTPITRTPPVPTPTPTTEPAAFEVEETKTPHYVSTSVVHGEVLASPPTELSVAFNFTLASPTELRVSKDGETIATSTSISEDRLMLSGSVPNEGNGTYVVSYDACWPDGSCHQGQFGFVVSPSQSGGFGY